MRRTSIYFSERQTEQLKAMSRQTGLSAAELVRRAIDAYVEKHKQGGNGVVC